MPLEVWPWHRAVAAQDVLSHVQLWPIAATNAGCNTKTRAAQHSIGGSPDQGDGAMRVGEIAVGAP